MLVTRVRLPAGALWSLARYSRVARGDDSNTYGRRTTIDIEKCEDAKLSKRGGERLEALKSKRTREAREILNGPAGV